MHFHKFYRCNSICIRLFHGIYFRFSFFCLQCSKSIDSRSFERENSIDCETNQFASTYSGTIRKKIVGKENSLAQKSHVENKNVKSTVTSSETPTRQAPSSYLKSKFYYVLFIPNSKHAEKRRRRRSNKRKITVFHCIIICWEKWKIKMMCLYVLEGFYFISHVLLHMCTY